jgi:hypothetical protein
MAISAMRGAGARATKGASTGNGAHPGVRGRAPRRAGDALALLADDHARVAQWFARFAKLRSDGPQKAALVLRICDAIELHARVEEEIFYPTVRALIGDDDLMDEAAVEHEAVKSLVEQLRALRPGDFHYDAKVTVLGEYVRHHVDEEQRQMFPKVRRTGIDLIALGRALKARRRQLRFPAPGAALRDSAASFGGIAP